MLIIHPIDSLESGEVKTYRTLRQPSDHEREGIFVAEGEKVVSRLVDCDLEIISILITPEWLVQYRDRLESRNKDITVYVGEKHLLSSIVGFHLHQGIMAVAKIPAPARLETVLEQAPRPYLFAAVDGITNSENLGVLVRNCAAFGVHALLVGETSSSPYLRRAVRNSMGTIFKMPVVQCTNLCVTLRNLQAEHSVRILAAHPHAKQQSIVDSDFRTDCCLVFGSEGNGISHKVLNACSEIAAIPMELGVDSINVASASAVFLFEVMRQRAEAVRRAGSSGPMLATKV